MNSNALSIALTTRRCSRFLSRVGSLSVIWLAATVAYGQVAAPVPGLFEGPVNGLQSDGNGGALMTVMGTTITVPPTAAITTPAATLTVAQLLDPTPLPGRTQPGFLAATTITQGSVNPATGEFTTTEVFVEPAENIIVGTVTENLAQLRVNGIPVVFLNDPRIPASPVMNDLGFEINLASVPVGAPAALEGYYSNDGSGLFYAFLMEVEGVQAANPALQVSITRVRGDAAARSLEVGGGVSGLPAAGAVNVQIRAGNRVLGTVAAVRNPLLPGTAAYRFRGVVPAPFPAQITARVTAAGFPTVPRTRVANSAAKPTN